MILNQAEIIDDAYENNYHRDLSNIYQLCDDNENNNYLFYYQPTGIRLYN